MGGRERHRRAVYQDAVEYLCVEFASLNEVLGGTEWVQAVEAVKSAEPHTEPWYRAVRLLHEAVENGGVPGGLGLTTPMGLGDWPGPPRPVTGWVCPNGSCSRVRRSDSEAGAQLPASPCHLLGQPMRRVGD